MLESLSDKLQGVLKNLKGEGRISEKHIAEAMRQIRIGLLEADVNFKVVKEFVSREPLHEPRSEAGEILKQLVGED